MRTHCAAVLLSLLGCHAPSRALDDVDIQWGDLPLIISAPHGGRLRPSGIENRTLGRLNNDVHTADLAWRVSAELETATGQLPHLVVNNLHRQKLDANREIVEAAQGDPRAEAAWAAYHDAIEAAREAVAAEHLSGLYIDLHGHSHELQRIELGYLLLGSELALSAWELDQGTHCQVSISDPTPISCAAKSSVAALVARPDRSLSTLLHGDSGLGALLSVDGVPAVPSNEAPSPVLEEPYWSGGYSTARHGSRDGGVISGVQLEVPYDVRQTASGRSTLARRISSALIQHLETIDDPGSG